MHIPPRTGFQEDLITYYRDNASYMSLSPLVEEHDVPLMDFYVRPSIKFFVRPHILSKSIDQREHSKENFKAQLNKQKDEICPKKNISSYKELFFQEDVSLFTKIYLTAPAGMGKSSLSQHITMCWCQSHKPVEQSAEKYKTDDLKAMKEFDLLFLLHLRECEGQCNLDDLVIRMCSNLSRRSRYNKEFVETVLHERRCLIILDGLDEWTHPSSCRRKPCVPHNNHPKNCTVLTTSRPWKLGTIGLSSAHIDRHVEITELDIRTTHILETNAITILNERGPRNTQLSLDDFHKAISSIKHDEICNITYIKLQLITLWYDGIPISKSRCEIYSNIIELTLMRGLKKSDLPLIQNSQPNIDTVLPKCMKNNALCKQYINLISKIGRIAFFSLFNEEKESRLIINQDMVLQHLTESEIEFCLKTGLLSQTKDLRFISKICHKMFFQHKSIQEFFAALYISEKWENDVTRATSLKICQSVSEILEMSNVFIFLCGMNPCVYSSLFNEFQTVVEQDPSICIYRSILGTCSDNLWNDIHSIMRSYQEMQVACLKENVNNENDEVTQISIHDIVLGVDKKDESFLQTIINSNPQNIKSLNVRNDHISIVDLSHASDLIPKTETFGWDEPLFAMTIGLRDSTVFRIPTKLLTIICFEYVTLAGNTLCSLYNSIAHLIMLKTIRMTNIGMTEKITNTCSTLDLSKISQLNQIHLADIFLNKLVLCRHSQLRQLHLASIPLGQLDHFQTGYLQLVYMEDLHLSLVDLSLASRIQQLHIKNLPLCELYVNAESLENCIISKPTNLLPHDIFEQITESIQNAKDIQNVTLENIQCLDHNNVCIGISLIFCQHTQLQKLTLDNINITKLDISQTYRLQELMLKQINLHELDISQNRQLQKLTLESIPLRELDFSQNNQIQNLTLQKIPLRELNISQNNQLEELKLESVPVKELDLSQTNHLQNITFFGIPISVLDISQNSQLQQLRLSGIPLQKLKLNTDALQICSVINSTSSCALTHNNLNVLVSSVQKSKSLVTLTLGNIVCSDHADMCVGVPMVLCQHRQLEELNLISIPLKELHLIQTYKLHNIHLKKILVQQLDLTHNNMLKTLNLSDLSLTGLHLSQNRQRCKINLKEVKMPALAFKEMLLIIGNKTASCNIKITQTNMTGSALRQVILSTQNLPQHVSVKLDGIKISDSEWNEVLSTIRSLSQPVSLKLTDITMADLALKDVFSTIDGLTFD